MRAHMQSSLSEVHHSLVLNVFLWSCNDLFSFIWEEVGLELQKVKNFLFLVQGLM